MLEKLQKLNKEASKKILSFPENTKIRVISHYDADGITAAAIICKSLKRAGFNFHCSLMRNPFYQGLEKVKKEKNELIIFSDMGSGQIEFIEEINADCIILDHHQPIKEETKEKIIQINANLIGFNGNYDACGASMAYMFAKSLDKKNKDLSALALIGATGDKQYIGSLTGLNKIVLKEALEQKVVESFNGIKLAGESLYDALFYSVDPFYPGISGDSEGIKKMLKKLDLSKDKKIEDLTDDDFKKINSYLVLLLIKKNVEKNILDTVVRNRYIFKKFDLELEFLADVLDSCGKNDFRSLGLSTCLGDPKSLEKALEVSKNFKTRILEELLRLQKDGATEKKSFRYFYSGGSCIGGVVCSSAVNYVFDNTKPLFAIRKNEKELHISCRGNQKLVKNGLDLGAAMKEATEKIDGHGGGHAIAAGATIDSNVEKKFLETIDDILYKQLKK
jgi:single-stranded-DNA-specific exonuclease